jgi:uncharacterized protein YnzC (UPF0291/DUF896 family)
MSTNWLAAVSFQQGQDILHAINILSIHRKLRLRGITDEERNEKANEAKDYLTNFLRSFGSLVREVQKGKQHPVTGVNPRMNRLAHEFVSSIRKTKHFRQLSSISIQEIISLMDSENEEDQRLSIKCLSELRLLIEQHMYTDANQILGKF